LSIEAISVALHHSKAQGTAKLVLLGIANHQGDGGAWPAVATLAKYAGGVTPRSVQRALRELEAAGEISCQLGAGGSYGDQANGRPNLYQVLLKCPAECDGSINHRRLRGGDAGVAGGMTLASWGDDTGVMGGATPTSSKPDLEPVKNQKRNLEANFTEFYNLYPRKQAVGKARLAFKGALKKASAEVIIEAANRYANDPNLPEPEFIPWPATWLNQERWLDEPLPERSLTPEEAAERRRQISVAQSERSREQTIRILEETRLAEERAAANPPKRCEHDRIAAVCRTCQN
jgi:hypothetical protein